MEKLLRKLHPKLKVQVAGTGTIYLQYAGKKIRIADHEPNYGMRRFRGSSDLELYTKDITGETIMSKYDVIVSVSDFFDIDIPPNIRGALTRYRRSQQTKELERQRLKRQTQARMSIISDTRNSFFEKIRNSVGRNLKTVHDIIKASEAYGELGSSGDKRRKRTVSYFKREFNAKFGFDASPNDVKVALGL